MAETQRRSRRSRRASDTRSRIKINAAHKRLFLVLDPFYGCKFATTRWLNWYMDFAPSKIRDPNTKEVLRETPIYMSQMAGELYAYPNCYLDRHPDQEDCATFNHREAVYHLDQAGRLVLEEDGYPIREAAHRNTNFAHEFGIDHAFYWPMMFAVRADKAFKLRDTRELFESKNFPKKTRERDTPFTILVDGERVRLDGRPVVIGRSNEKRTEWICSPGIQYERGGKGVRVKDTERSSVGKHIRHAITAHEEGLYEKRFGFDRIIIPFIFTNRSQMLLALDYIRELKPAGCNYIICKHVEDLAKKEQFDVPSGEYFLSPWLVAGEKENKEFRFDDNAFFK